MSHTETDLGVRHITLGQSVTDNVTVSGLDGFVVPTVSVTFKYSYEGGDWVVYDQDVQLVNGVATSTFVMPLAAGHYEFRAVYSGDSNYLGSKSCYGSEPLCVGRAGSTTTTDLGICPPEPIDDTPIVY